MIKNRKYAGVNIITILLGVITVFGIIAIAGLGFTKSSSTNDIYLIPEGFEGDIQVNYNVQGAPALEKEGKYDVIPIGIDGTYNTSNPDMEYGLVTDQYFYVSHEGKRTPIDTLCVNVR
ncbi:hypothetical protein GZH47_00035 [Paenibacillus rhizovicinus]|uniref:DUF6843 domain-containing protein n=1 Tax=Paenibacillus rhizovicinus TaxID=2704463 RepID=A0A6C0NUE4_9BACL|nr:hypothetical protein [Paenibacillus rhizovicinus]QHW29373.1 hypothetical protein GZH47_00035 [Paenibacillus rhizovicinus]